MKISKNSVLLMTFFLKNNYINHNKQTKKTNTILLELYNELIKAYNFLLTTKKTTGDNFYNINISKITSVSQIPKPKIFGSKSFPKEIRKCIDDISNLVISYTFSLFNRNIRVFFVVEKQEQLRDILIDIGIVKKLAENIIDKLFMKYI